MSQRRASSNNVRTLREEILLSKAELARRAGISPLTVDRIEGGAECRLDTKRKIILALGKKLEQKEEVFPDLGQRTEDEDPETADAIAARRSGDVALKKLGKKE